MILRECDHGAESEWSGSTGGGQSAAEESQDSGRTQGRAAQAIVLPLALGLSLERETQILEEVLNHAATGGVVIVPPLKPAIEAKLGRTLATYHGLRIKEDKDGGKQYSVDYRRRLQRAYSSS